MLYNLQTCPISDENTRSHFCHILDVQYDDAVTSGRAAGFGVIVTSRFEVDDYEEYLKDSLPMGYVQPVCVFCSGLPGEGGE